MIEATLGVEEFVSGTTSLGRHRGAITHQRCEDGMQQQAAVLLSYSSDLQTMKNAFFNSAQAVACFVFHEEQRVSLKGDLGPRTQDGESLLQQSNQEHIIQTRFCISKYLGNPCRFQCIR